MTRAEALGALLEHEELADALSGPGLKTFREMDRLSAAWIRAKRANEWLIVLDRLERERA